MKQTHMLDTINSDLYIKITFQCSPYFMGLIDTIALLAKACCKACSCLLKNCSIDLP